MTPELWARIKEIFEEVSQCDTAVQADLLGRRCKDDVELKAAVERLLVHHGRAGDFLEVPPVPKVFLPDPLPGETFAAGQVVSNRYHIAGLIGRGGMGEVYQASDLVLGGEVALKTIRPEIASDPRAMSRFRREVHIGRSVTHPNICRIFDIESCTSESGDVLTYLTMEMLPGDTVAQAMRKRPLPVPEVVTWIWQMASALDAAHRRGIIHRDFKPGNVILVSRASQGRTAVVTDFGLAHASDWPTGPVSGSTESRNTIVGTPAYMAPEQLSDGPVTAATDIFAFGLLSCELLTGRAPFPEAATFSEAVTRFQSGPPQIDCTGLASGWDSVLSRCLELDWNDRPQSASELLELLRPLAGPDAQTQVPPVQTPSSRRGPRAPLRGRTWLARFAAACAIAAASGLLFVAPRSNVLQKIRGAIAVRGQAPVRYILIGEIKNQTGDAVLDGTIYELLTNVMGQSREMRIYPASQLSEALRRMGKPTSGAVGPEVALELCQRENINAAITGTVRRIAGEYLVTFTALDPRGNVIGSTTTRSPNLGQLISSVEAASAELRNRLGESIASIRATVPLEKVTSRSLQAIQYYSWGKVELNRGNAENAISLFQQATAADPEFAMAHCYLGIAYQQFGDMVSARNELSRAVRLSQQVGDLERLKILGDYSLAIGDFSQASRYYKVLTGIEPREAIPRLNLGQAYLGEFRFDQALSETEQAILIQPGVPLEDNAAEILFEAGRTEEALARTKRILNVHPDDFRALLLSAKCYLNGHDIQRATKTIEKLCSPGTKGESMARGLLADIALTQGRLEDARRELQRAIIADEHARNPFGAAQRRLVLKSIEKGPGPSLGIMEALPFKSIADDPQLLIIAADLCYKRRAIAQLKSVVTLLDRYRAQYETPTVQSFVAIARSQVALLENRPQHAVELAQSAVRFENSTFATDHLGAAYAYAGMTREAIKAFEDTLRRGNERTDSYDGPAWHRLFDIHRELARLYTAAGNSTLAAHHAAAAVPPE